MKIVRESCRPGGVMCHGVLLAFALCDMLLLVDSTQVRHRNGIGETFYNYDYSKHGMDWVAGSCSSRTRQSPIDLPAVAPVTGIFFFRYMPVNHPFDIMNTGKTLVADVLGHQYGGIVYNKQWYELTNINVHSYSEHTFVGKRKPLELHLVHKSSIDDHMLIIAVPIEGSTPLLAALAQTNASAGLNLRGSTAQATPGQKVPYIQPFANEANFNPTLQAFLVNEPPVPNMMVEVHASDQHIYSLEALVQGEGILFYEYGGSLTAPPCSEEVTWLVRGTAIKASDRQISYLHGAISKMTATFGNYRYPMPLNGRTVSMKQGVRFDVGADEPTANTAHPNDREVRARKWASEAMDAARKATHDIKKLDKRLRYAAVAHADVLFYPPNMSWELQNVQALPDLLRERYQAMHSLTGPIDMEKTAPFVVRALANHAQQAIDDGTIQIGQPAKDEAAAAVKQATNPVSIGDPNMQVNAVAAPMQPMQMFPG